MMARVRSSSPDRPMACRGSEVMNDIEDRMIMVMRVDRPCWLWYAFLLCFLRLHHFRQI
jgi:hypothetical protein